MEERKIRIFGIPGSPRIESTDHAVRAALDYARDKYSVETEYFSCHKKELNFCIHCDYCVRERKGCIRKDDMWEVYDKLEWTDAVIIGTPVYQGTLSEQIKVIMDRCRALVVKNPQILRNRVGVSIAVGGDKIGGQEPAIQAILNFYLINEMILVGEGSFGANMGVTFWSKDKGADGVKED